MGPNKIWGGTKSSFYIIKKLEMRSKLIPIINFIASGSYIKTRISFSFFFTMEEIIIYPP